MLTYRINPYKLVNKLLILILLIKYKSILYIFKY